MISYVNLIALEKFELRLNEATFTSFTNRMVKLGYSHTTSFGGNIHYFHEGFSTREEMFLQVHLNKGENLYYFDDNFYDKNLGGPLYNILEAVCEKFKGTLIGTYGGDGMKWEVEIINGIRNTKVGADTVLTKMDYEEGLVWVQNKKGGNHNSNPKTENKHSRFAKEHSNQVEERNRSVSEPTPEELNDITTRAVKIKRKQNSEPNTNSDKGTEEHQDS